MDIFDYGTNKDEKYKNNRTSRGGNTLLFGYQYGWTDMVLLVDLLNMKAIINYC